MRDSSLTHDLRNAFLSRSARLIDRARQSNLRGGELFYERSSHAAYGLRFSPSARAADRLTSNHKHALVEGAAVRRDDGPSYIVDGFAPDRLDVPALAPADDVARDGEEPAAFPSDSELTAALRELVDGAPHDAIRSIAAGIRTSIRRTLLIRDGRCIKSIRASTLLRVDVTLPGRETGTAVGSILGVGGVLDPILIHAVAERAMQTARHRSIARVPPPGDVPVLLMPGWNGIWLHEAIGHMLEADVFPSGPFAGCFGKQVAPPFVHVFDDPGDVRFDDEGQPTRQTRLIQEGIVVATLTDRATSNTSGVALTGNGRRQDYRHPPLPRQWGVRLRPGDASTDDLLEGIGRGVAVLNARRARVFFDGSFVLEDAIGHMIENGRLTSPVASFSVGGEARSALQAIEAIGSDAGQAHPWGACVKAGQTVPVTIASPAVRFRTLSIGR